MYCIFTSTTFIAIHTSHTHSLPGTDKESERIVSDFSLGELRLLARSVSKSSYDVVGFLDFGCVFGRRCIICSGFEAARYITCLEDTLFECWRLSLAKLSAETSSFNHSLEALRDGRMKRPEIKKRHPKYFKIFQ